MAPSNPVCTVKTVQSGERELVCENIEAEGCVMPTKNPSMTPTRAELAASKAADLAAVKAAGKLYSEFKRVCAGKGPGFSVTPPKTNPSFTGRPADATGRIVDTGEYCVTKNYTVVFACEEEKQPPPAPNTEETFSDKPPVAKAVPAEEKPALEIKPSAPPATPSVAEPKPQASPKVVCPNDNSAEAVQCRANKAQDELNEEF